MRPTIYIHMGMHKTGTTSIQTAFFRNRRWLRRRDLNYLSIAENHSLPLVNLVLDESHRWLANVRNGIDTGEKAARYNAKVEAALRRELANNTCSRLVISGEEILGLKPPAMEALKAKLAPYAADIRVFVYVREPYSYISSAFQEQVREGRDWDLLIASASGPHYRRIKKLIDIFGRDRVDIRVFDKSRFRDGDLMSDFFAALGLDSNLARRITPALVNKSLSHEATLIFAALNKVYPTKPDEWLNRNIDTGIFSVLQSIRGRPFRCPHAVFERLQPNLEKDVAWLNATMGEQVFSAKMPDDDCAAPWSDETTRSLAIALNELAKDSRWSPRRLLRGGRFSQNVQEETIWQSVSGWIASRGVF